MDEAGVRSITRPHPNLLTLYLLQSLLVLFAFPFVFLPLFFKYRTLRYSFDDEGISAAWGFLFKREIHLTYRRIQDIHVSRNLIERWLGIGKVEIQTASGSASAELAIEGMEHYGAVRDFLYGRMRGTGEGVKTAAKVERASAGAEAGGESEMITLLRAIKDDIEGVRRALESRSRER
jgi:putative membrane protein